MQVAIPESRAKRMAAAIAGGLAVLAAIALVFMLTSRGSPPANVDGLKIVAAGRNYTRDLIAAHKPIPKAVFLNELVEHNYLKPADVAAFQGLDATLSLFSDASDPAFVLMRVHMPDGADLVLLADGTAHEVGR